MHTHTYIYVYIYTYVYGRLYVMYVRIYTYDGYNKHLAVVPSNDKPVYIGRYRTNIIFNTMQTCKLYICLKEYCHTKHNIFY